MDPSLDGLTLDGLYEPDESAPAAPCRCSTCTKTKWMSWEEMQQRPGQWFVTGLPMTVIMPKGFTAWAKKPPAAWVKWISQYEKPRRRGSAFIP